MLNTPDRAIYNTNTTIYFEPIPKEITTSILCNAFFFNGDYFSRENRTVCKAWHNILKEIIQTHLPSHKRDLIINRLYSRALTDKTVLNELKKICKIDLPSHKREEHVNRLCKLALQDSNILIEDYATSKLASNSSVKFIYDWLGYVPKEILEISDEKDREIKKTEQFHKQALALTDLKEMPKQKRKCGKILSSLLEKKEIESAFALAAKSDQKNIHYPFSLNVQKYLLLCKKGLKLTIEEAYGITEALNTNETRAPALTALFNLASKEFLKRLKGSEQSGFELINTIDLIDHPFIKFLNKHNILDLPSSAVSFLLKCIADVLLLDFKKEAHKNFLVKVLFKNIPETYQFSYLHSYGTGCIIKFYDNTILDKHFASLGIYRSMSIQRAKVLIEDLKKIPHAGLRRQIYDSFCQDFINEQNLDMRIYIDFWDYIETEIGGVDHARQVFIYQSLKEDLTTIKTTFSEPINLIRLVKVLKSHPKWLLLFENEDYEKSKGLYMIIGELLKNNKKFTLLSSMIENIECPTIKKSLKEHFAGSLTNLT